MSRNIYWQPIMAGRTSIETSCPSMVWDALDALSRGTLRLDSDDAPALRALSKIHTNGPWTALLAAVEENGAIQLTSQF